jgi:adenine-specific DNA-methyltransferase
VPASTGDDLEKLLAELRDLVPGAFPNGVLDARLLLESVGAAESSGSGFAFSWTQGRGPR